MLVGVKDIGEKNEGVNYIWEMGVREKGVWVKAVAREGFWGERF